jgi:hypothetical protein
MRIRIDKKWWIRIRSETMQCGSTTLVSSQVGVYILSKCGDSVNLFPLLENECRIRDAAWIKQLLDMVLAFL